LLVLLANDLFRSEKGAGFVDVAQIVALNKENGSPGFCVWLSAEKGVVLPVVVVVVDVDAAPVVFNAPNLKLVAAGGLKSSLGAVLVSSLASAGLVNEPNLNGVSALACFVDSAPEPPSGLKLNPPDAVASLVVVLSSGLLIGSLDALSLNESDFKSPKLIDALLFMLLLLVTSLESVDDELLNKLLVVPNLIDSLELLELMPNLIEDDDDIDELSLLSELGKISVGCVVSENGLVLLLLLLLLASPGFPL
jgi:hypothetical protein